MSNLSFKVIFLIFDFLKSFCFFYKTFFFAIFNILLLLSTPTTLRFNFVIKFEYWPVPHPRSNKDLEFGKYFFKIFFIK